MDQHDLDLLNKIESLHTWLFAEFRINEHLLSHIEREMFQAQLLDAAERVRRAAKEFDCEHINCSCSPMCRGHFIRNRIFLPNDTKASARCAFCGRAFVWAEGKGIHMAGG